MEHQKPFLFDYTCFLYSHIRELLLACIVTVPLQKIFHLFSFLAQIKASKLIKVKINKKSFLKQLVLSGSTLKNITFENTYT